MHAKPRLSSTPIHDIIQNRWSPRAFAADKMIDPETILTLLEAARWAPSCFNDQPWRFVVCNKADEIAAWEKLLGCLGEKNQLWAQNAPILILTVAMHNFAHNDKPNRWSAFDTGASSISLCLQATAMGLITHQMGGFDAEKCQSIFNLPENCTPMSVIAVGYQAPAMQSNSALMLTESKERSRKPLEDLFYFGAWKE